MVKISHKTLLALSLLLLLVFVILIVIGVSQGIRIGVPGINDSNYIVISFAFSFLFLSIFVYVMSRSSQTQRRILRISAIGAVVSFPFAFVGAIAFQVLLGLPRDLMFVPLYFVGWTVGIAVGEWGEKRKDV